MDTRLIWAAGFMDGEGTITIKRYKSPHPTATSIRYQAYISCGQVNKPKNREAIMRLQELFGGSVCAYTQPVGGQRIDTISWQIASNKAKACAEALLPHLLIKRPQAELLIEYCSTAKRDGTKLSDKELARRNVIWARMRKLNVKGKLHLQRLNEETPSGDVIV